MQVSQVLPFLLLFCLIFFNNSASAQVPDSVTRRTTILTETAQSRSFKTDKVTAYVNGHQTKIAVLSLFKPTEIEIKTDHSADQTSDYAITNIHVKDKTHPVLTYFEKKAKLQYLGKLYEHNDIPDINPAKVQRVQYHNLTGSANESLQENYLEVIVYGEEYVAHEKTVFSSAPRKIGYYDVDGKIMTQQELPILMKDTFTSETLFGKEAAERYGDAKFAEGIIIIRTKK